MEKMHKEKERTACPFYGFHMSQGSLVDTHGNQCALIINSYSPCQMEYQQNKNPNWNECSFVKEKERIEEIIAKFKVFPKEFRPEKESFWKGVPFDKWKEYTTNKEITKQ